MNAGKVIYCTYLILNGVQLDIKEMFEFGGYFPSFSEIGRVFPGTQ